MNILQLELESVRVLLGMYGKSEERKAKLSLLSETYGGEDCAALIQDYVNRILGNSEMLGDALADYILTGNAGSGDDRLVDAAAQHGVRTEAEGLRIRPVCLPWEAAESSGRAGTFLRAETRECRLFREAGTEDILRRSFQTVLYQP